MMDAEYRQWRSALAAELRPCMEGLPDDLAQLIIAATLTNNAYEHASYWDAMREVFTDTGQSYDAIKSQAEISAGLFRRVLDDYEGRSVYDATLNLPPTNNGTFHIIARSFVSPVFCTHINLIGEPLHKSTFFYTLVTGCSWAWDDAKNVHSSMEAKAEYAAGVEQVFISIQNLIESMEKHLPYIGEQTPMLIRYADWDSRKIEAEIFRTDLVDMETGMHLKRTDFTEPPPCPSVEAATESGEPTLNQLLGMVRSRILNTFEDLAMPSLGNAAEEVIGQSRKKKGEIVQLYLRSIFEKLRQMSFPIEGHIENHILPIARIVSGLEMEPHHIRQAWKKWSEYRGYFRM
ncbi:hypothetical protein [Acidithiobacillus marinus]|nr:hypothetical protein [Acidithiobacillus marinus]